MPDLFHNGEISAALTEVRLAAQQLQRTAATATEVIENLNRTLEKVEKIVDTVFSGVLK